MWCSAAVQSSLKHTLFACGLVDAQMQLTVTDMCQKLTAYLCLCTVLDEREQTFGLGGEQRLTKPPCYLEGFPARRSKRLAGVENRGRNCRSADPVFA